jgi:hypothetical protein
MTCRNVPRIRSAILDAWDSSGYPPRGTVPFRPGNVVAAVHLDKLRVVHVSTKVFIYSGNVPAQAISRKLESSLDTSSQIADECVGACAFAFADVIRLQVM